MNPASQGSFSMSRPMFRVMLLSACLMAPLFGDALASLRPMAEGGPATLPEGRVAWPRTGTGLFDNPAALAGTPQTRFEVGITPASLLAATHWHGLVSTPSTSALTLAAAGYGTIHEPFSGDIGFRGDAGRAVNVTSAVWAAGAGLGIGTLLELPFRLDFGVTARFATGTTDGATLSGFFVDGGLLFLFPHGEGKRELSFGVVTRGIGWSAVLGSNVTAGPHQLAVGAAYGWQITSWFRGGATVDGTLTGNDPLLFGFSVEGRFWNILSLRLQAMPDNALRPFTLMTEVAIPMDGSSVRLGYLMSAQGDMGLTHGVQVALEFAPPPKPRIGL